MIISAETPVVYDVYPLSVNGSEYGKVFMANLDGKDILIGDARTGLVGSPVIIDGEKVVKAELSHENACVLRELFPFTAPRPVLGNERTMGVGDRLGIATTGHIKVFDKYDDVYPVLAQQSMRELKLTGRTYYDVLDTVTFAVFKHGFKRGFGADGDHLKTPLEVEYALSCGFSMITLDCSEYIRNDIGSMKDDQVNEIYTPDDEVEARYVGKYFDIGEDTKLFFTAPDFRRISLIYGKAIDFTCEIYNTLLAGKRSKVDLEVSIDETSTPTTPLQHFFIANELIRRGVPFVTIAPRFCGEFQKGIDYIGDIEQFERELKVHAIIARHFGYKLSIHSGSDKFSIFSSIGRLTNGVFHIKTAGTNWLEAMCVVALKDPAFYREVHKFALKVFDEARKYYHVTTDLSKVPDIDSLTDTELPVVFLQNDARQLIHITYGLILSEKDSEGQYVFRDRLHRVWDENQDLYASMLQKHIGRHLELLCRSLPKGS